MSVVVFSRSQIADLKRRALEHPLKRARVNLHASLSDKVQEMVIAEHKSTYVRPHRHPGRLESFHVVEGELTVVMFDDAGNVTEAVGMGGPGGALLYRQLESVWHTVLVESEFAVVHEVVEGPFPYTTQWAEWAPNANDVDAARAYTSELRRRVL